VLHSLQGHPGCTAAAAAAAAYTTVRSLTSYRPACSPDVFEVLHFLQGHQDSLLLLLLAQLSDH
jgi:hypothetical protein